MSLFFRLRNNADGAIVFLPTIKKTGSFLTPDEPSPTLFRTDSAGTHPATEKMVIQTVYLVRPESKSRETSVARITQSQKPFVFLTAGKS